MLGSFGPVKFIGKRKVGERKRKSNEIFYFQHWELISKCSVWLMNGMLSALAKELKHFQ